MEEMLQINSVQIRGWTSEMLQIECKTEGPGHSSGDPSLGGGGNTGHGTKFVQIYTLIYPYIHILHIIHISIYLIVYIYIYIQMYITIIFYVWCLISPGFVPSDFIAPSCSRLQVQLEVRPWLNNLLAVNEQHWVIWLMMVNIWLIYG